MYRVREYLSGDGVVPADIQVNVRPHETKYVTWAQYNSFSYANTVGIEADDDVGTWYTDTAYEALPEDTKLGLTAVAQRLTGSQYTDGHSDPIKISETEWPWTSLHKLTKKAYVVVDIISPFNDLNDPDDDLFQGIPNLEFLVSGLKFRRPIEVPDPADVTKRIWRLPQEADTAESSDNAVAQMYWYDTERLSVPVLASTWKRLALRINVRIPRSM